MLNFGVRKQDFHIEISIEESTGDNTVTVEIMDDEGQLVTLTGEIVIDE